MDTETTAQLLDRHFVIVKLPIEYGVRLEGGTSKLRTFQDGARVLLPILGILKAYKPLTCFDFIRLLGRILGGAVDPLPVMEYARTGFDS